MPQIEFVGYTELHCLDNGDPIVQICGIGSQNIQINLWRKQLQLCGVANRRVRVTLGIEELECVNMVKPEYSDSEAANQLRLISA